MILTQEFLTANQVCESGQNIADIGNYIGQDFDFVIRDLLRKGYRDEAAWMQGSKSTETYVRMNGSILTMGAYQVFNPLTGTHTRYETEEEAKQALVAVAKDVLAAHVPQVVQEISNEKGDAVWIPVDMVTTLVIS